MSDRLAPDQAGGLTREQIEDIKRRIQPGSYVSFIELREVCDMALKSIAAPPNEYAAAPEEKA